MDFFTHQERAQRRTWWLLGLTAGAVLLLLVAVYIAVTCGLMVAQFFLQQDGWREGWLIASFWEPQRFAWVVGLTLLVLVLGSWYKIHQLKRGGGQVVAEQLGGKRIPSSSSHILYRRVLNVVEEMAIASGLPVPPVYVLEQSGINAFAAGLTPSDTVIGVTQGALTLLNRDELQAVIGHEFSHILHGDTTLNMRMLGLLHGITLVSDAGIALLSGGYASPKFRRKRNGTHPALWVLGLLLFMVGLLGLVAADLIKRAISRQREFLADASAVQFTRNPEAMANALKVIGGYRHGAAVQHVDVGTLGYFFFAHADVKRMFGKTSMQGDWWASHPPLLARIRRIEPGFRGTIAPLDERQQRQRVETEARVGVSFAMPEHSHPVGWMREEVMTEALLSAASLQQAVRQLNHIPEPLKRGAHDPYTARALCYSMLLSTTRDIRSKQWKLLEQKAESGVLREMLDIHSEMKRLTADLRLPLLDISIPALKELSQAQYQQFIRNIRMLIQADHQVSMFEYALHRILLRHLKPAFEAVEVPPVRHHRIQDVDTACACILALLIGYGQHASPEQIFDQACVNLFGKAMPWPPERMLHMKHWDAAIRRLQQASPSVKKHFLQVCVQVVFSDGILHVKEMAALRAIADGMDCPMPAA